MIKKCWLCLCRMFILWTINKMDEKNNYWLHDSTGRGPIIANLHVTGERTRIVGSFFADNYKWWQIRQQYPALVSWIIQKKSGKTPIGVNICEIFINCIGATPSGDASRYHQQKNIANWCSKDRKILVTPSFFVVRPFLLTSLLMYISFPPSQKDGDNWYSSLPIQWQKSTTLQRISDTSMRIKIIYISVQGNIQNYEALEEVYWTT